MLRINGHAVLSQQLHLRSDVHIIRKLWHILTGLSGLAVYYFLSLDEMFVAHFLMSLAFVGFALELIRLKFEKVNVLAIKFMGLFMRESEKTKMSGLPFYALGVSLALYFYPFDIAMMAILFLIFADPISSYFGVLFGKEKIVKNKSLQGTTAGFITCYTIALIYLLVVAQIAPGMQLLVFSLAAGVVGAVSEIFSIYIDDNLTIPVLSGAGMFLINFFIPLF